MVLMTTHEPPSGEPQNPAAELLGRELAAMSGTIRGLNETATLARELPDHWFKISLLLTSVTDILYVAERLAKTEGQLGQLARDHEF
jgi:hypothetical protein